MIQNCDGSLLAASQKYEATTSDDVESNFDASTVDDLFLAASQSFETSFQKPDSTASSSRWGSLFY